MKRIFRLMVSTLGWFIYACIAFTALGLAFMYYGRDWSGLEGIFDQFLRIL